MNLGGATLVGVIAPDSVTLDTAGAVGTFATPDVGTNILVTVSGLTTSGTKAGDYSLIQPTTTASITNPVPTTSFISPTSTTAGGPQFTLTVDGTNFTASSTVYWDGVPLATIFTSSSTITATVPAVDIATAGTSTVTVVNSAPGGGTSNAQTFTILNPVPTTTSITPDSVIAGGASFTLTINGTNFVAGSVVNFNGSARSTTFSSSTELTATINASDIAVAGTASITVVNSAPGGGTSNSQTLTIDNPAPTTTSISPTSTTAGGSSFTLTVDGTNFVTSSVVDWNGSSRATTFSSSTELTATINASDIAVAGTASITVVNPVPGGGTSNVQTFTIVSGTPTISSISPTSTIAGGPSFTLTVDGTNFTSTSTVDWNGSPLATTFSSSTEVTASVPASDIATNGTSTITIVNSGGTSNAQIFTILNPTPVLTSISPTSTSVGGSGFTLNLTGTGFVSGSQVDWNGSPRTTNYISSSSITAAVLTSDLVATGTAAITVTNGAPGGGTSGSQIFTIVTAPIVATRIVIIPASSTSTAGTNVPVAVQAQDNSGNIATTFDGSVTLTTTGSATGGGVVTIANGVSTSTLHDTVAETVTLALQDTGATGLNVSSTATVVFSPGPVAKFVLNHPGNMNGGTRLGYTVSQEDQYNNPAAAATGTVVYLYSNSTGTPAFFNASSGGSQITSTTIPSGATSTTFWYYDTVAGTWTITASANSSAPTNFGGVTDGTDNVTVTPGAVKFIFANVSSTTAVGNTATFNVEAVDSFNNIDTTYNQDVTMTTTGSATGGGLVTIINGVGTSTAHDTVAENVTLGLSDTQSTGLNVSSTATIDFLSGPVVKFVLNHPGDMNTGTRLGYVVGREDQYNNPAAAATGTVVYLYSNSTGTPAFFNASSGGSQITSTTIPSGATSTTFWYYDTVAGTVTVTASDNSSGPASTGAIASASDTFSVKTGAVKFVFANVPSIATTGNNTSFNVEAVDSFGAIDPSFNIGVTVTKTGSATGGGLVTMIGGIGTTTVTDLVAENVTLGLSDTQGTGLGVTNSATIAFASPSPTVTTPVSTPSSPASPGNLPPTINLTFSGWAYPKASISFIREDQGITQPPVIEPIVPASDGSFAININNVLRLGGQTYLLSFVDPDGRLSHTKVYDVAMLNAENGLSTTPTFAATKILAAPTLGFQNVSIISQNARLGILGYATPKSTVTVMIDSTVVNKILVTDPTGKYVDVLTTDNLPVGRHSITAFDTFDGIQGDNSDQESFTISPLANPRLDLNGDGTVNYENLNIFLADLKNIGANLANFRVTNPDLVRLLDFNNDGAVDVQDLSVLLQAIGRQTP